MSEQKPQINESSTIKLPDIDGNMDDVFPFSLLHFLHKRNEENLQTTFHELFTEFKEDVLFSSVLDKLLEHKVIAFENNIVKLLKKPDEPQKYTSHPKPPIFDYDDRYIEDSKYTIEELINLQKLVVECIEKYPTTWKYELSKYEKDQDEIQSIIQIRKCNQIENEL